MTRNVAAIIMAGGAGERLWPLTAKRAKPAVPIAGKFRLIDIPISNCLHSEVNRIFVLTQYMSRSLNQHVAATYHFDPFRSGFVQILAAQQTAESTAWYQGTADAVRRNLQYFDAPNNERFLILAGDHLYSMDFRRLLDWHARCKAEVTVSAIPVARSVAHHYGILKTTSRGRITRFVEKPTDPAVIDSLVVPPELLGQFGIRANGRELIASMGIYVFERQTLFDILSESQEEDFGKGIIPYAIKTRRVYAYMFDGYWEDIGTIRSFYEAMIDLTRPVPKFNFYTQRAPIFTRPRYLPGAIFLLWLFWVYVPALAFIDDPIAWRRQGDILARYTMGFPGGLLAAYGLRRHAHLVLAPLNLTPIVRMLRLAGLALLGYAFFAGLVGPAAPFFPADWINQEKLQAWTLIPVQLYRSLLGLVMAVAMMRALEVFRMETDRRIRELEEEQLLLAERERIGRELHERPHPTHRP